MRVMVVLAALVAATLAGCASTSEPTGVLDSAMSDFPIGPGSHPASRFPVRDDLPMLNAPVDGVPTWWHQPDGVPLPDKITGLIPQGIVSGVESGSGITIFGSLAFVGSWTSPDLWAVDISNLDDPVVVGHLGDTVVGDIETIAYPPSADMPGGMLVLVISTRGANMQVIDATDPTNMTIISVIESEGNHNHQIVPGTPYVYNARGGTRIDIYDLTDPYNPVKVQDWPNDEGCHAIDFYVNSDQGKYLGFCAAYEFTQIFDITNPLEPVMLSATPFPFMNQDAVIPEAGGQGAPNPGFSHLAMANHDGTVMIMGDETGGGAAPGCDIHFRNPVTGDSFTGPYGNLYFYDITDPTAPVLHGAVSPSAFDQRGSCTAHFGDVIGDRNQLVMAYYTVGVVLIDFEDLDNPYIQDFAGRDENDTPCTLCGTWDAQYYRGHVLTGDIDKGMGLLTFD